MIQQHIEDLYKILQVDAKADPDVIRAVQRDLAAKDGLFTCLISTASCASEEALAVWEHRSDHAGEEETSLVMHLRPELVREEHITDNPQNLPTVSAINDFKVDFVRPWHLYIPASAGGNATKSSAEKGRIVVDSAIDGMGRLFSELSRAPDTENFPY